MPCIPPEITDHIIDHLHDSPDDLRACARVCRAWLPSSRVHLFYSISIDLWDRFSQCCRLYETIQQSPDIAFHTRELRCRLWNIENFSDSAHRTQAILLGLLQSFRALRRLEIPSVFSWVSLSPDIRKFLHNILALPSLVDFKIFYVRFPRMEHLTNLLYPHLKRLSIRFGDEYSSDDDDDEVDPEVEREPCRLEHLFLHSAGWNISPTIEFVNWLLGPQNTVDISNIRTFGYRVDHPLSDPVQVQDHMMTLLKAIESSIECLEIRIGNESVSLSTSVNQRFSLQTTMFPFAFSLPFGHILCSKLYIYFPTSQHQT
jgi:hypothetical protein